MSAPQEEYLDLVVGDDGTVMVHVSADELARLGARPGDHLMLVRGLRHFNPGRAKKYEASLLARLLPRSC
jgi:hypothetical protein